MAIDVFEGVRERIRNGEMQLGLDELKELTNDGSAKIKNELTLHIAKYNQLYREYRQGVITRDEYSSDLTSLSHSILQFVDYLEKESDDRSSIDITTTLPIDLPEDTAFEKVIGADNLKQINWLRRGLELATSVCRILTPIGRGTGFMIGPGLLMTNNHVIPNVEIANQSVAEFNYELDALGNELPSFRYTINADVFHTSDQRLLDYTIVGIHSNTELPALEKWGTLKLNATALPFPNEHVTIIQHPQGGFKKIAITANQIVNRDKHYLHYTTDTMRGSSGSPVLNDAWEVIATHHAYGGIRKDSQGNQRHVNEGILMDAIRSDAGELWPDG